MRQYLLGFLSILILTGCGANKNAKTKNTLKEMSVFISISKVESVYAIETYVVCKNNESFNSQSEDETKITLSIPKLLIEANTLGELSVIEKIKKYEYKSEVLIGNHTVKTSINGSGVCLKVKIIPTSAPETVSAIGVLSGNLNASSVEYEVVPFSFDCNLNKEYRIFYKSYFKSHEIEK